MPHPWAAPAGAPRLLLSLALLAALALPARSQLDDCMANSHLERCRDYTVPQAVLERDLSQVCAASALGGQTYTGWPSACSLWHECTAGRGTADACQPLALLQTACNDLMGEPAVCQQYFLLCAPQSAVQQCLDQPPIRSLRPAVQFFTEVLKLCNGTRAAMPGGSSARGAVTNASLDGADLALDADLEAACRNCSAVSADPDKVVVQATEANCPDPLGTLSTICRAADADARNESCAAWLQFCESDTGAGFPWLCGGDTNIVPAVPAGASLLPASPKSPAPAAAPTDPTRASAAAITQPDCYAKPQQERCRIYQQSDAASRADIEKLCSAIPSMVGCTLWQQCISGAANGSYCQPFSALGSICSANTAQAGCQRWAALCSTPGSVVQQCITAAPIRNVLMTSQTMDAVVSGCSSAGGSEIPGCELCVASGWNGTGCPQPLAVMSQLCSRSSPGLPQCSNLAAMCAEAGTTFSALCSGTVAAERAAADRAAAAAAAAATSSTSSGSVAEASGSSSNGDDSVNKMWLHASMTARILFYSWVPSSGGAYVASCLALMAVAVAVQGVRALHAQAEARWAVEAASGRGHGSSGSSSPAPSRGSCEGAAEHGRRSSAMSTVPMLRASLNASGVYGRSSMSEPAALPPLPPPPPPRFVTREELARNAARAAFSGGLTFVEYMLMLVAMTFNLGLIISVSLGFAIGALAFGHLKERAQSAASNQAPPAMLMGGMLQAPAGADLELQYGQELGA